MVTFENLAYRACAFTGVGTLSAILANTAFGARANLMLASILGAAIGSAIGWILLQQKLPLAQAAGVTGQRPARHKAAR